MVQKYRARLVRIPRSSRRMTTIQMIADVMMIAIFLLILITSSLAETTRYTYDDVTHFVRVEKGSGSPVIIATAGSNGSILPSGIMNVVPVDFGTSQTFAITPNDGYQVSSVLVDGTNVGSVSSYTFTNVTDVHTIDAQFAIKRFTLTVALSDKYPGAGSINIKPPDVSCSSVDGCSETYDSGTPVTLTPQANEGYAFHNWSGDYSGLGIAYVTVGQTMSITANFVPIGVRRLVQIGGTAPEYFSTLQAAYDAASDGATIMTQGVTFTENLNVNRNISVTFDGGYDNDSFTTQTSTTTVTGMITSGSGSVNFKNFRISH